MKKVEQKIEDQKIVMKNMIQNKMKKMESELPKMIGEMQEAAPRKSKRKDGDPVVDQSGEFQLQ